MRDEGCRHQAQTPQNAEGREGIVASEEKVTLTIPKRYDPLALICILCREPNDLGGGLYWRGGENWSAKVSLLHAFDQHRIAPEEAPTAGYNLLNAELTSKTKLSGGPLGPVEVTAGVKGTNLLNETIRNAVSFRKDEVVAPGRGVRAFLSAKF